jgi:hypothetical protein
MNPVGRRRAKEPVIPVVRTAVVRPMFLPAGYQPKEYQLAIDPSTYLHHNRVYHAANSFGFALGDRLEMFSGQALRKSSDILIRSVYRSG